MRDRCRGTPPQTLGPETRCDDARLDLREGRSKRRTSTSGVFEQETSSAVIAASHFESANDRFSHAQNRRFSVAIGHVAHVGDHTGRLQDAAAHEFVGESGHRHLVEILLGGREVDEV